MSMQWIMRWGHDFPKDKGVGMLTLNPFEENPCVMGRTHQNCQQPSFLSFLPNHLFCQKVVEVVIAWKGKSMGNFELGRAPSPGMSCFVCMDKKTPKPYASLTHAFTNCFTLTFWELRHVLVHGGIIHRHLCFPREWHCGSSEALPVCIPCILRVLVTLW